MKKRAITVIVCVAAILGASTATVVAQSQRFPDVPPDHYAFEAAEWAAEVGVTTGYGDGTFKPQRPLSKRHAVVFMERYYDEILQAEESEDFTRGDMMVLLKTINDGTIGGTESDTAAESPPEQGASQRFPDVPPDHYAYEAAEWAAEVGVTTGYGDGTFKPQRPLSKRHAVVFMERFYDEILQAEESEDFTRGDMMVLLKTINDGTIGGTESAGTARGEEAVGAQSAVPPLVLISNDTEAFITRENDFSRYIKENIIEQYEDRQPWLRDVWNHTNRFDFSYLLGEGRGTAAYYGNRRDKVGDLPRRTAVAITASPDHLSPVYNSAHIHELAHVYTKSNRIVANPAPIAAGHIYFSEISQGGDRWDCQSYELYAETVQATIFGRHPTATNWGRCPMVPDKITVEAVKVVHQAFNGQMPQWFYDTFYDSQGNPDHQAIWVAVLRIRDPGSRLAAVNQLRYSFGGYCYDVDDSDTTTAITGWVDAGC